MNILRLSDFKQLNGLSPTIESTFIKLEEEKGEVAQILGKMRKMSGEEFDSISNAVIYDKLIEELMDISQVCATMIYILHDFVNIEVVDVMFNQEKEYTTLTMALKKMAIFQGKIAMKIFNLDDEIISLLLAQEIISILLDICNTSCNAIYFVLNNHTENLDNIVKKHTEKLILRKYLKV